MSFHISNDGVARACKAQSPASCPVTLESVVPEHFDTLEAAQNAYENVMEQKNRYNLVKSVEKDKTNAKNEQIEQDGQNKTQQFTYVSQETLQNFKNHITQVKPLFNDYEHDYSSYNPDDRKGEREFINNYDPTKYTSEKVSSTADNIILRVDPQDDELKVLMIQRGGHPFKNCWAHPGGFIDFVKDDAGNITGKESPDVAAKRELEEETGMVLPAKQMAFVKKYDHPGRDPRMDVHMNTHVVLLDHDKDFAAADDASDAKYVSVKDIYSGKVDIAFDHKQSIKDALLFVENS